MTVRLFSIVHGDAYVEAFRRYASVSVGCWPRNLDALRRADAATWEIWTDPQDAPALQHYAVLAGFQPVIRHLLDHHSYPRREGYRLALIEGLARAIKDNRALLMMTPDLLFADGSMDALLAAAAAPGLVVGVPHVRVDAATFGKAFAHEREALTPPKLVKLAFRHLHPTWRDADLGRGSVNTFASGVSWRALPGGRYLVQHRLPAPFLVRPLLEDVGYFQTGQFTDWDHRWPATLVQRGRWRVLGSSDAAFAVEPTPAHENLPAVTDRNPAEPDEFRGALLHHQTNRSTIFVLREEP